MALDYPRGIKHRVRADIAGYAFEGVSLSLAGGEISSRECGTDSLRGRCLRFTELAQNLVIQRSVAATARKARLGIEAGDASKPLLGPIK